MIVEFMLEIYHQIFALKTFKIYFTNLVRLLLLTWRIDVGRHLRLLSLKILGKNQLINYIFYHFFVNEFLGMPMMLSTLEMVMIMMAID